MLLGVNIDHVATLRNARGTTYPSPLEAALLAETHGADLITLHLREDRRHIKDADVAIINQALKTRMNLEMALTDEMLEHALKIKPADVCLVPEKREEVTTEGGLDVLKNKEVMKEIAQRLKKEHIELSLFIDPNSVMVEAAHEIKAQWVELHTGLYANIYAMLYSNLSRSRHSIKALEVDRETLTIKLLEATHELEHASKLAHQLGLKVAAGHGLNYQNVKRILEIKEISELNIGQSIIARSVFTGFEQAVKEMLGLLK